MRNLKPARRDTLTLFAYTAAHLSGIEAAEP